MVPKIRFLKSHAFGARGRAPSHQGARPPRAPSACASPARGEACAQRHNSLSFRTARAFSPLPIDPLPYPTTPPRVGGSLSLFSSRPTTRVCFSFLLLRARPSARVLHSSQPPTNRSVCFYRGTGARPRIGARLPVRKLTPAVRKLTRRLPASGARALQTSAAGSPPAARTTIPDPPRATRHAPPTHRLRTTHSGDAPHDTSRCRQDS